MSEIERWAIESGLADSALSSPGNLMTDYGSASEAIMAFAALVRAAEREANALKCDAEVARLTETEGTRMAMVAGICAAAIRKG